MQVERLIQCLGQSCNQYYPDAVGERAPDQESRGWVCGSSAALWPCDLTSGRLTAFSDLVSFNCEMKGLGLKVTQVLSSYLRSMTLKVPSPAKKRKQKDKRIRT